MNRWTLRESLIPQGWGLFEDGNPAAVATFALEREGVARLVADLLNRHAGANGRPLPVTTPEGDALTFEPYIGCEVTAYPSGWAYVRFARKPDTDTRDELKAAGARWLGARQAWRLLVDDLPKAYRPGVTS